MKAYSYLLIYIDTHFLEAGNRAKLPRFCNSVQPREPHLLGEHIGVLLDGFVPHRLKDGCKGGDTDSCTHQHDHLVAEHILTGRAEGAIHCHPAHTDTHSGSAV